jgi:hypothetical protein
MPVAVVVGLKHRDAEDAALEASPEFWRMIEDRRLRATRPLAEAKAGLLAGECRRPRRVSSDCRLPAARSRTLRTIDSLPG